MRYIVLALFSLVFAAPSSSLAVTYGAGYTYTNTFNAATRPVPVCTPAKFVVAPNERVQFVPKSPVGTIAQSFLWKGEVSTTTSGAITLAFIYPGQYTVVLRANGFDGTYTEVKCPTLTVSLDAARASTVAPATYLFTFAATSTKAEIPREYVPVPTTCLNLGQDVSYGYRDDVINPKDGVIYNLQMFLNREGYLKAEPTGYFGGMTRSAVQTFQRSRGISPTGYVGPMTRSEIKSQTCLG